MTPWVASLSPVTVAFKILMQEVYKVKVAWDQPLAGELLSKWENLIGALKEGVQFRIPRHYLNGLRTDPTNKMQLFGFCDASNAAYAAVVYIVEGSDDRNAPSLLYLRLECPL